MGSAFISTIPLWSSVQHGASVTRRPFIARVSPRRAVQVHHVRISSGGLGDDDNERGEPPSRDRFVPVFVMTAIVGYTIILAWDLLKSWDMI